LSESTAGVLSPGVAILLVILLAFVSYYITKWIIISGLAYSARRTSTRWDDFMVERKVIHRLAYFAPALVIYVLTPLALHGYDTAIEFVQDAMLVVIILIGVWTLDSLLNAVFDIYDTLDVSKEFTIRGPIQVAKIVVYFIGGLLIVALLLDKSPLYLLTGLGALSAVLMLVFKDPILGFAAGIQLSANKMVMIGDWVEMPKYNADGDVIEVGLTTVKVQNWDKTITMIPTYALISESFKNWRGMQESGGRRIKRSIHIDISSIRFCTGEMLERFAKIQYIADYIAEKKAEVAAHNQTHQVDTSILVNGRHLTNVGTFRAYVVAYLRHHPMVNQEMTFLVRQLAPTEHGLPIQIYVFSSDKVWANYEAIQADIFDHLLAVVLEFDLQVFQNPTGSDFKELVE
jgi:miniconductance mechanosensitive channel